MENVKICNLDILAPVQKRQIILGGQTYPVETLTVNSFIEFNKARLDISKNSLEEGFKMALDIIRLHLDGKTDQEIAAILCLRTDYVRQFLVDYENSQG